MPTRPTKDNSDGRAQGGFARMKRFDPDRQRTLAGKGGRAAHEKGNAHEFDSDEARKAGQKGGEANARNRNASRPS